MNDLPAGYTRPFSARDKRIVRFAIATVSLGTSIILLSTYSNAISHDPWLTPRFAPYMLLWWRTSRLFGGLNALSAIACAIAWYDADRFSWRATYTFCLILNFFALWLACCGG